MTRDVIISTKGFQYVEGNGNEPVEVITRGEYFKKNGKHYLVYDEITEGIREPIKNIVKFSDDMIDVTKRGAISVHMVFERNCKNDSWYSTPYGGIRIGINTGEITIEEEKEHIVVKAGYKLDVNYEFMADCEIVMEISACDPKSRAE